MRVECTICFLVTNSLSRYSVFVRFEDWGKIKGNVTARSRGTPAYLYWVVLGTGMCVGSYPSQKESVQRLQLRALHPEGRRARELPGTEGGQVADVCLSDMWLSKLVRPISQNQL